ncbi:hypothetical protein SUGI_0702190 [Cryptomeria japonica]|nr:hypothetical protein SUGI_0702190 [Cryptomeria japonica]
MIQCWSSLITRGSGKVGRKLTTLKHIFRGNPTSGRRTNTQCICNLEHQARVPSFRTFAGRSKSLELSRKIPISGFRIIKAELTRLGLLTY